MPRKLSFLDILHVASHQITVRYVTAHKTYVMYACMYKYCVRAGLYDSFCSPVTYLIKQKLKRRSNSDNVRSFGRKTDEIIRDFRTNV